MQTKLPSILIGALVVLLVNCNPSTYISKTYNFKSKWRVVDVVAPSYPFRDDAREKNEIEISFPKQGEFTLHLSANSCGGTYEANMEGYVNFTRTSCTEQCCQTEWDYYILTLVRKASRHKGGDGYPLYLYIDKKNYIVFELNK